MSGFFSDPNALKIRGGIKVEGTRVVLDSVTIRGFQPDRTNKFYERGGGSGFNSFRHCACVCEIFFFIPAIGPLVCLGRRRRTNHHVMIVQTTRLRDKGAPERDDDLSGLGLLGKKVIDRRLGSPTHNVWSRFFEQRKMCVITTRYRCRFCLKKMYTFWGKREKCRSISFSYAQNKKSRSDATPDLSDFQQFDFWPRDDRV